MVRLKPTRRPDTNKSILIAAILLCLSLLSTAVANQKCPVFLPGRQTGTLQSNLIDEASGIAASRKNRALLWVHNDSGDSARVYAIHSRVVRLRTYSLAGITADDVEDIAIGPGPAKKTDYLYIADIGDNHAARPYVMVYRVPEPAVDPNQPNVTKKKLTAVETIKLKYPDGPRDAETLMLDPPTRDLYIVSKRENPSKLYRAPWPQSTTKPTTMQLAATLPWPAATAGDISPTGDMVLIRSYTYASLWLRPNGTTLADAFATAPCQVPLVLELQGEAICFTPNAKAYYTTSEGHNPPIYYFPQSP